MAYVKHIKRPVNVLVPHLVSASVRAVRKAGALVLHGGFQALASVAGEDTVAVAADRVCDDGQVFGP